MNALGILGSLTERSRPFQEIYEEKTEGSGG